MTASIDTNVFVYAADPRDQVKQHAAREIIRRTALAGGVVAEQCLFEFVSVSTRRLYVAQELAVGIAQQWTLILGVIVPPTNIFDLAAAVMKHYKISGWDARLVTTCEAANVSLLLSEDLQDGGRYGHVTVLNPFKLANGPLIDTALPP